MDSKIDKEKNDLEISQSANVILEWMVKHWWIFLAVILWWAGVFELIADLFAQRLLNGHW